MFQSPNNTLFLGKTIDHLTECLSTNDELMANTDDLAEGHVVITDHQTKGRGQRGNSWETEKGKNLTFSLLLKPTFLAINDQFYLNMIISLGIIDTLKSYQSIRGLIKWPNDIFVNNRKIAGILIENAVMQKQLKTAVVGVGLNIYQEKFNAPQATSLRQLGVEVGVDECFEKLLENIEARYLLLKAGKKEELKAAYLSQLLGINTKRSFNRGDVFEGTITGIDDLGRLLIEEKGIVSPYNFKEVEFMFQKQETNH